MRGASLVELLVAVAIGLVSSGLAVRVLIDAADAFAWQPATSELAARAEAVAQLLTADLTAAGAGPLAHDEPLAGPPGGTAPQRLVAWLPPILPRVVAVDGGDADDTAAIDRVSILAVADGAPQAAVRRLPPRWGFVPGPTCPPPVDGCGIRNGLPLLWLDARPGFQLGEADAVDASGLEVRGVVPTSDDALAAGVEVVSYRFDAARGELMRGRASGRGLAVAGHIAAFEVELWGDAEPPVEARWTPGVETCLTLPDGRPRLPAWAAPGAPAIRLDVARLSDGPWCGAAPFRVDADLFRVRRVRIRLRLEAEADGLRSRDPARAGPPGVRVVAGSRGARSGGGGRRRAARAARDAMTLATRLARLPAAPAPVLARGRERGAALLMAVLVAAALSILAGAVTWFAVLSSQTSAAARDQAAVDAAIHAGLEIVAAALAVEPDLAGVRRGDAVAADNGTSAIATSDGLVDVPGLGRALERRRRRLPPPADVAIWRPYLWGRLGERLTTPIGTPAHDPLVVAWVRGDGGGRPGGRSRRGGDRGRRHVRRPRPLGGDRARRAAWCRDRRRVAGAGPAGPG